MDEIEFYFCEHHQKYPQTKEENKKIKYENKSGKQNASYMEMDLLLLLRVAQFRSSSLARQWKPFALCDEEKVV